MKNKIILLNILILTALIAVFSCKKQNSIFDPSVKIREDDAIIDKYLADSGIVAQNSSSGLRYVIHDPGFGAYPAYGKKVRINYKGMLLDGTVFADSFKDQVAFEFTVGTGEVITGMNEGIQYLKERGKITLYIPSLLAYGPKAAGPLIKPDSNLVFYIGLLNVE